MIIGCDPGRSGSLAYLTNDGDFIAVKDLPIETYMMAEKGKEQWRLNVLEFAQMVENAVLTRHTLTVGIEWGWARPGEGVSSARRLGTLLGALAATLTLSRADVVEYVMPMVWKKHFKLIGQEKGESLDLARKLFPDAGEYLTRKRDHNRAEALLIARYLVEIKS